jgi:flagellar hook protein FlgE
VQWIIKRFKAADTEVVSKNPTRKEHAAMSLSGSLAAAVAGLTAQSRALGHISDNVANSQTTGYKRVESRFNTLVTTSTSSLHSPGGVRATPFRMNDVQGTVTSSAQVTNMALLGSGFLAASKVNGVANGLPTFEQDPVYTRAGDFSIDKDGYLVNTGGYFLNAWSVNEQNNRRITDRTSLQPMRVSELRDAPSPTTRIEYGANLPANIATSDDAEINSVTDPNRGVSINGDPIDLPATQVTVYDALGKSHNLDVQWSKPTTRITDALGVSTTELGELQDNAGTPFVNKNIWYATLNGDSFSFAPKHINDTQTLTSVNETRYKLEFYDTNDTANGITSGGIRAITELQNYAAQSVLETATAPVTFDGTFNNVGLGVSLNTLNSSNAGVTNNADHAGAGGVAVTGRPQFIIDNYNTTSGEFTARISQITTVAGANTNDTYSDKLYSGFVPLNIAGQVDGPVTLTHTQTETGTLDRTNGAKTVTATTPATGTTDVFTLNPPVGLPSSDLVAVAQTMINANLGANPNANRIRDAVLISGGNVSSLDATDALSVRAGHTVNTTAGTAGDPGQVELDINGLQVGQSLTFLHTDAAGVQSTVTITVPGVAGTNRVDETALETAINGNANLVDAQITSTDTRKILGVSTSANNQNVTMKGLPNPEAFANNNFDVTSYNSASGEMTVTAGGRNYTAVVNRGEVGPNTGGAGFVRLVDSADTALPFNEQRSIYVEFQGARAATTYTDNQPNNIIPASSGIPVTSYGVLLESHVRPGSYSGASATITSSVNPLEIRGTTNPQNFLDGQFNVDSIDQTGRVTVTIGSETYSGVLPLNGNGEIRFTVGPPLAVEPVNLTSTDGTRSFQITFDDPWDIDGRMLTTGTNTGLAADVSANIVLADPGSNLKIGVLPDEARQPVTLNFGSYGQADLVTSYAGEEIDFLRTNQDGVPPGSFRDLTIDELGFVTLNYDNGRRRTFYQIPVAQFDNPNALNAEQGNAFTATFESGEAALTGPGASGSGTILSASIERSNVDIAEEFSKLIITQRTYSANSRVVTASDNLLNETVNLVR